MLPSTASTATSSTLTITTTAAASETTSISSCPTSSKGSTPTPTTTTTTLANKSSSKPNTGLIVGLTLTMILLVLLTAIYCFLRRRRQGLPFFLGVNLKGSKISLGRGGNDSGSQGVGVGQRASDIGNIESGYGHAVVGVVPAEKSHEGETQNPAQGPAPTETAEAVAQDQMSTGEPVDTTSTSVAAAAAAAATAATAAEAGSRSIVDPGATVIDIPELSESHRFSGNTQDDTVHSNNAASGVNDRQQTPADSLAAKSIESAPLIGAVESKHSRLYRAASGPTRKLKLHQRLTVALLPLSDQNTINSKCDSFNLNKILKLRIKEIN
ncbi:hypothetical protein BGZ79_003795 [Entomortierella chlamydospora]|nr:hypothetical protein BGZ79_003795 [Entomortierella chlamydospora]